MKIQLTPEQADRYHETIRGFIDRIHAADPTEPISPLWIASLTKDYYFEDEPQPVQQSSRVDYYEYIKSPQWKEKARQYKIDAGNCCQVCNSNQWLDAHHRTYANLGNEQPGDVTVLCRKCHKLFSKNGQLAK